MARFFTNNEIGYLMLLLTGEAADYVDEYLNSWDGLMEDVDEVLMEVLGYGLQDIAGLRGHLDSTPVFPPWKWMELPYQRLSRPEARSIGVPPHYMSIDLDDMRDDPLKPATQYAGIAWPEHIDG